MWDQPPLIRAMLPGSPPVSPRLRGGFCPKDAVQPPAASGPEPIPRPGRPPPRHAPSEEAGHRGLEVPQELIASRIVLDGKADQFLKDVVPILGTRMVVRLPSGHHLVGDPAEPSGGLDTDIAWVLPLQPPTGGQDPEMVVTFDQVIGNHHDRAPQVAIGIPDQRAVAVVNLIALVAGGVQAGSARDASGSWCSARSAPSRPRIRPPRPR